MHPMRLPKMLLLHNGQNQSCHTFPITNAVRGMLQRNTLGADMLSRLRVYAGADHGHEAQKPKAITFDAKGDMKIG